MIYKVLSLYYLHLFPALAQGCFSSGITLKIVFSLRIGTKIPCELWFLQDGRYASMGKKPLRATVCFSIEHARPGDDFEYPTTIGLISKATTLHVHYAFIFAFLFHFCTTTS